MEKNRIAQQIARETMSELHGFIRVGMSEKEIETRALELMSQKGSNGWWYHGIGALVLLGERSVLSMSGRDFFASPTNRVAQTDVVTIDLAPTLDGFWGDYARTIFVEDGVVAREDQPQTPLFRQGIDAELLLHQRLIEIATPEMTYEEIFFQLNAEITRLGFENLDVHGNLGHSVEMNQAERIYLERGSTRTLQQVGKMFTFEPHIRQVGGVVGFKREDIYLFDASGTLRRL